MRLRRRSTFASTGYHVVAFVLSIPTAARRRWFLGNVIAWPSYRTPGRAFELNPGFDRSFEEAVLTTCTPLASRSASVGKY